MDEALLKSVSTPHEPVASRIFGQRTTNGQTRERFPKLYSGPSSIPSISMLSGGRASSSCASRNAAASREGSS